MTSTDCKHVFEDTTAVFTGTARTRACRECSCVEVMVASSGRWVSVDDYLQRVMANRTAMPEPRSRLVR